jgi:hypothetical protein
VKKRWWAVVPIGYDLKFVRIEKALTPERAIELATGSKVRARGHWRVKDLGTRITPLQSDRKRNNLLREQERRDMTEWITERMHELPKGSLHKATGTPRGKKISKTALITLIKTTKDKALRARAAICLQRHHVVSV